MNQVLLRKLFLLLIISNPFLLHAGNSEIFWSDWIQSAIISRESFFRSIEIIDDFNLDKLNDHQKSSLLGKMDSVLSPNSWHNLLHGMINDDETDNHFSKALHNCRKDPGTTWLLFIEFTKIKEKKFADNALKQLHKLLLEAGAQSSSLISQQLLHFAIESKNDKTEALEYIKWAKQFDSFSIQPEQKEFWINFPVSIITKLKYFISSTFMFNGHWETHLRLVYSLYIWFRNALILFVISVFSIYIIKHFPSALHFFADLFPGNISLTLRTFLVSAIMLSFVSFGFIPFLWFSAFLIWRYLNIKERTLLLCALFFLLLAPVDAVIRNIYQKTLDPDSVAMVFSRAVREGYSEHEHRKVYTYCKNNPSDYLANLTNAIYSLKNNNLVSSLNYGEQALALHPHDPVVQTNVGNIFFLNGNFDKAKSLYKLAADNGYVNAQFNLAQCLFNDTQTASATELIKKAALQDPESINRFLQNNDDYFTDNWPSLRKIMFADYQPKQFWTILVPSSIYNRNDVEVLWGNTFLGLSSRSSFFLSFVLYTFLLIITFKLNSKRKLRITFECRYCGKVICRKCKTGLLCNSCSDAIKLIHNEKTLHKIHLSIWSKFQRFRIVRERVLNILFPGAGFLLGEQKPYWISLILVSITSLIYSFYFSIVHDFIIREGFSLKSVFLIISFSLYNLIYIIKQIPLFIKN
ncbi:MAG TPA: hypothetical protein VKY57_05620 [Chitinispirillaceae bacterium]|nr:hypothetical protein [Chitinispirillaceae bacterium]